jgi:tRNA-dihydrouridine synthase C
MSNACTCSLLRDPQQLHATVACLVAAVGHAAAVSVKMRSGFQDTSLFRENLLAVQVRPAVLDSRRPMQWGCCVVSLIVGYCNT